MNTTTKTGMRQYTITTTDSNETERDLSLRDIARDYVVDDWELDAIADMPLHGSSVIAELDITRTADRGAA